MTEKAGKIGLQEPPPTPAEPGSAAGVHDGMDGIVERPSVLVPTDPPGSPAGIPESDFRTNLPQLSPDQMSLIGAELSGKINECAAEINRPGNEPKPLLKYIKLLTQASQAAHGNPLQSIFTAERDRTKTETARLRAASPNASMASAAEPPGLRAEASTPRAAEPAEAAAGPSVVQPKTLKELEREQSAIITRFQPATFTFPENLSPEVLQDFQNVELAKAALIRSQTSKELRSYEKSLDSLKNSFPLSTDNQFLTSVVEEQIAVQSVLSEIEKIKQFKPGPPSSAPTTPPSVALSPEGRSPGDTPRLTEAVAQQDQPVATEPFRANLPQLPPNQFAVQISGVADAINSPDIPPEGKRNLLEGYIRLLAQASPVNQPDVSRAISAERHKALQALLHYSAEEQPINVNVEVQLSDIIAELPTQNRLSRTWNLNRWNARDWLEEAQRKKLVHDDPNVSPQTKETALLSYVDSLAQAATLLGSNHQEYAKIQTLKGTADQKLRELNKTSFASRKAEMLLPRPTDLKTQIRTTIQSTIATLSRLTPFPYIQEEMMSQQMDEIPDTKIYNPRIIGLLEENSGKFQESSTYLQKLQLAKKDLTKASSNETDQALLTRLDDEIAKMMKTLTEQRKIEYLLKAKGATIRMREAAVALKAATTDG